MRRSVISWLNRSGFEQARLYSSVLVVQERQQTQSQTAEALRLAETYAGTAVKLI